MRLYDTLTRELRELKPIDNQTYRFYCCGPTVYGPAHIGNFRTFVMQDVFRRAIELGGTPTKHVRNLTDVDDKTIRDSQAAGKTLTDFTQGWTEKYHVDCAALNCLVPDVEPGAVDHIPQQIVMIEKLIENGHAYAAEDGSVYFKISSYPEYGALSHLDERDLDLGKTQSRPGWHIECSAMSREHLGDSFDLHSGGEDLIFPHHENEIAQSKCSFGGDFAAHWFHVTHLLVDGKKMAKRLGNFYILKDLLEQGHTAIEVRYALIGAHYRRQMNFTLDGLHAAREALGKLLKAERALAEKAGVADEQTPNYEDLLGLEDKGLFENAWLGLNEDLNTQRAIGAMFGALKRAQNEADALVQWKGLHFMLHAFGIELPKVEEEEEVEIPVEVQQLAEERWQARADKDWAKSDELRDKLKELGWVVKDGKEGWSLEML